MNDLLGGCAEGGCAGRTQVVQALGAPESEALDFSNPKKIDGDGSIALVEAAAQLGVDQFVMVTSLGTAKFGWPAGALPIFLCRSAQAAAWLSGIQGSTQKRSVSGENLYTC